MAFYDEMRDLALSMLTEFGAAQTYHRASQAAPADSSKPWEVQSIVDANETVRMALFDWDKDSMGSPEFLTEANTAGMVLIAASDTGLTAAPRRKDTVTINARKWTIEHIETIQPAGSAVLYILGVAS